MQDKNSSQSNIWMGMLLPALVTATIGVLGYFFFGSCLEDIPQVTLNFISTDIHLGTLNVGKAITFTLALATLPPAGFLLQPLVDILVSFPSWNPSSAVASAVWSIILLVMSVCAGICAGYVDRILVWVVAYGIGVVLSSVVVPILVFLRLDWAAITPLHRILGVVTIILSLGMSGHALYVAITDY